MTDRLRIGDADREAASAELAEHLAAGRLDVDEHAERLDAAWSARTRADLDALFLDLPPLAPPARRRPHDVRRAGAGPWAGSGRSLLLPVAAVLVVLTVLTHLPFVLLALAVVVFVQLRRRRQAERRAASAPSYVGPGWRR